MNSAIPAPNTRGKIEGDFTVPFSETVIIEPDDLKLPVRIGSAPGALILVGFPVLPSVDIQGLTFLYYYTLEIKCKISKTRFFCIVNNK